MARPYLPGFFPGGAQAVPLLAQQSGAPSICICPGSYGEATKPLTLKDRPERIYLPKASAYLNDL